MKPVLKTAFCGAQSFRESSMLLVTAAGSFGAGWARAGPAAVSAPARSGTRRPVGETKRVIDPLRDEATHHRDAENLRRGSFRGLRLVSSVAGAGSDGGPRIIRGRQRRRAHFAAEGRAQQRDGAEDRPRRV